MACNFLSTLLPDVALPTLSSLSHCKSGRGDLGQWPCPFGCRNEGRKEYVICTSASERDQNLAFISHTLQKELKMDQRLWWKTCKPETTEDKHKVIVLRIGPQRHRKPKQKLDKREVHQIKNLMHSQEINGQSKIAAYEREGHSGQNKDTAYRRTNFLVVFHLIGS